MIRGVFLCEFHEQQRLRLPGDEFLNRLAEHRDIAGEGDHRGIDKLHPLRVQRDEMLGRIHRRVERGEVADAQHLFGDQRRQLQFDRGGIGEGAFGADQQMRHVVGRVARHKCVDVVAAHPPHHLGEPRVDLCRLAAAERQHVPDEGRVIRWGAVVRNRAEMVFAAVGEDRVDGQDIVAHGAVAQ